MKEKTNRRLRVAAGALASGGSQNFLGASWVPTLLRLTPAAFRTHMALLLLSLSPHYIFSNDIRAEHDRNRVSREYLAEELLVPFLDRDSIALDYGCGPGYMAAAVARRARAVEAVDVSRGVLACARWLNGASNIFYETPGEAVRRRQQVDLVYSFAVVQHLTDDTLRRVLSIVRLRLRPGGTLLLHFVLPAEAWRTEAQWRADSSVKGRVKLHYGLNCFGRASSDMDKLVTEAGFTVLRIEALAGKLDVQDDISQQHLLVASG